MKYWHALDLVNELIASLRDGCDRIEEAGSVRRRKEECRDLEIVAIPKIEAREARNLFNEEVGRHDVNLLEITLADLLERGEWRLDCELRRNGPRYKRLRSVETGVCCDLFLTTPRGWGGALAVRTGPAEFSQALVTLALRQGKHVADGYLIHGHPKTPHPASEYVGKRAGELSCPKGPNCPLIIPTPEETDFFEALGLRWIEPQERSAEWLWAEVKKKVVQV